MEQEARRLVLAYPVADLARAKALFGLLLGVEPYVDSNYYVGFRVGPIEVGLAPKAGGNAPAGAIAYFTVEDIHERLQRLLDGGANAGQEVKDVGGGALTATVKDQDGNVLGMVQM
ncbi:MAG TPA: VOC family protein [Candidatus Cybelea sp.]|jgi:predicted enzyme related to lactoylglutathione lyase|nr:VOC family protein [Candidatus Cybelea sp.]